MVCSNARSPCFAVCMCHLHLHLRRRRTLCCSSRAMSCDSRTDMSPGRMISISTLYLAPKWYARVMSTCAVDK